MCESVSGAHEVHTCACAVSFERVLSHQAVAQAWVIRKWVLAWVSVCVGVLGCLYVYVCTCECECATPTYTWRIHYTPPVLPHYLYAPGPPLLVSHSHASPCSRCVFVGVCKVVWGSVGKVVRGLMLLWMWNIPFLCMGVCRIALYHPNESKASALLYI